MQLCRHLNTAVLGAGLAAARASVLCSSATSNDSLAFRLVDSNIQRSQGAGLTSAATGFIQLGLFQQALRAAIAAVSSPSQKAAWTDYMDHGILSSAPDFSNVTVDVERPLDRLSLGTSYILYEGAGGENDTVRAATDALEISAALQPRNADGSLWYYDNVANLSLYHNLSYLDGMFSYAPFAILASHYSCSTDNAALGAEAAWTQVKDLYDITRKPSGLLVHGFDASKAHNWSNPITGASPEVWGRSLGWYTLGLLNSLDLLPARLEWHRKFRALAAEVLTPQIEAAERSFNLTGKYGVWQVGDRPGEAGNFIEASASSMTAYSLLHARRTGIFDCAITASRAQTVALGIYTNVLDMFLTTASNGTLDLSGTSTVASLSPQNVSYEYYTTRPVDTNDVLGTSAFILASLEVEKLCK